LASILIRGKVWKLEVMQVEKLLVWLPIYKKMQPYLQQCNVAGHKWGSFVFWRSPESVKWMNVFIMYAQNGLATWMKGINWIH
jgi:hypothetical protein